MKKNRYGLNRKRLQGVVFLCVILCSLTACAGPTGGPYGPVEQKYELPKEAGKIYYVAPDGNTEESGGTIERPTTLAAAISRAATGEAIVMRGGTYRTGELKFNQGITIQPYAGERPVLKGTFEAGKWEHQGGLWKTKWSRLFANKPADWWMPDRNRQTPLHRFNNDMVFIDGRFLQSAGAEGEVNENTFFINYDTNEVFIGADPTKRLVEITAYDVAFTRTKESCNGKDSDHKGPTIRGITFTQYANRAIEIEGTDPEGLADESQFGKEVVGTTFENCEISFCSRAGAYIRGDKLTIRNCLVSDTSTEGLFILSSSDVLLEKNIFRRNNIENISGYFPAGVKIFNQCHRVTCRDNLVTDQPNSNGIWYDVGNVDGRFINNRVENVGSIRTPFSRERFWPSENGFFFEISKGAICAGNVFVNCDHGIFVLNSSNVEMYQNTFVNSTVCIGRNDRIPARDQFGWHSSTGPDVNGRDGHVFVNNLLTADANFNRPLLAFWQPEFMCAQLNRPQVKRLDNNVYVRRSGTAAAPLILWSPAKEGGCQVSLDSPQDLHKELAEFSANCQSFKGYNGPLFKSPEKGDYRLLQSFPGGKSAAAIPPEVGKLMNLSPDNAPFVGAYPPIP